jgi:hypothetical protein
MPEVSCGFRPRSYFYQPPYQRLVPIGGMPLYKKQLSVFLQIFNILRKKERLISK